MNESSRRNAAQHYAAREFAAREALELQQEQARPPVEEGEHLATVLAGSTEVRIDGESGEEVYQLIHHLASDEEAGLWTVLWVRAHADPGRRVVRVTCTRSAELVALLRKGPEARLPPGLAGWDGRTEEVRSLEAAPTDGALSRMLRPGQRLSSWTVELLVRSPGVVTVCLRGDGEGETVSVDIRIAGDAPGGLQGPRLSFHYRGRGSLSHPAEWALDEVTNQVCCMDNGVDAVAAAVSGPVRDAASPPSQPDAGPSVLEEKEILPEASVGLGQPRCGLTCEFCDGHMMESGTESDPYSKLEELAGLGHKAVLLADGEPLSRGDIAGIVGCASGLGLKTVLHTSGPRLSGPGMVDRLAGAGLDAVHVSLYHSDAAVHDAIVGSAGAFARTLQGIQLCRAAGVAVRAGTIIMRRNLEVMGRLVPFLARCSGFPGVKVRWVRPPSGEAARYGRLTPRLDEGLASLVSQLGPALLWRSPLLWWTVPCAARAAGWGESGLWHLGSSLEHNYILEPQQELADCPLARDCVYSCRLYRLYVEGQAEPGLQPLECGGTEPLDSDARVAEWTLLWSDPA